MKIEEVKPGMKVWYKSYVGPVKGAVSTIVGEEIRVRHHGLEFSWIAAHQILEFRGWTLWSKIKHTLA